MVNPVGASTYIPCKETVDSAASSGTSVSEYVETVWNQSGLTDQVMSKIRSVSGEVCYATACEIGPGTGRYMERAMSIGFNGAKGDYHFYEVAQDWAEWLETKYGTRRCVTTGDALSETRSNWCEFIHAHGVFVYTPLIVTCKYLKEITRVTREEGVIVFDIYSDQCFSDAYLHRWIESGHVYPVLMSVDLCDRILRTASCERIGDFFSPHGSGVSHYLIYKRKPNDS